MIPVCYGSDEEQTRTAVVDAADHKCHTLMLQQNEREERGRKNTNKFMWFTLSKATSTGGKNKELLLLLMQYKWKLISENIGHHCLI